MSKWKAANVKIIQIQVVTSQYGTPYKYGLGSDGKVYCWDVKAGAWAKNWEVEDEPVPDPKGYEG